MGKGTSYSTNTRNKNKIDSFFSRMGYSPRYAGKTEPAAIGMKQEIVRFQVPGFDPLKLEGRLQEEWENLPIEVVQSTTGRHVKKGEKPLRDYSVQKIEPTHAFWNSDVPVGYALRSKCPECGGPTDTPGELCLSCCL